MPRRIFPVGMYGVTEVGAKPDFDSIVDAVKGKQKNRTTRVINYDTIATIMKDPQDNATEVRVETRGGRSTPRSGILLYRFTPKHVELYNPAEITGQKARARLHDVARAYGFQTVSGAIWPNRKAIALYEDNPWAVASTVERPPEGEPYDSIVYNEWYKTRRRVVYEEYIRKGVAIRLGKSIRLGYDGKVLTREARPTDEQIEKRLQGYLRRRDEGTARNEVAEALGFYDWSMTYGYPVSLALTKEDTQAMNEVARSLGFDNVAAAWIDGVPILSPTFDDFDKSLIEEGAGYMIADMMRQGSSSSGSIVEGNWPGRKLYVAQSGYRQYVQVRKEDK